jgi:Exostosin family
LIPDATFVGPEPHFSDNQAALSPYSSPHRDLLIPGHMDQRRIKALLAASKPMQIRTRLAAYKGSTQDKTWRKQVCRVHGNMIDWNSWSPSRKAIRVCQATAMRLAALLQAIHIVMQVRELARRHPDSIASDGDYTALMGDARFCLVPRGQSAWTRRAFEAFFAGCVPVLLSDHVELPFEQFVDYSKMTIKWPGDQITSALVRSTTAASRC